MKIGYMTKEDFEEFQKDSRSPVRMYKTKGEVIGFWRYYGRITPEVVEVNITLTNAVVHTPLVEIPAYRTYLPFWT